MSRVPLVLLVSEDEWTARSLSSVLAPRGYAVLRAYDAKQALQRAAASDPDAIFINTDLPDMEGRDLCRALIEDQIVARGAPILLLAHAHITRDEKLRALEAGAWDVVQLPLDAEELLLRLDRFIQGKLEVDQQQMAALIDPVTGLYNREGAVHRVREVGAAAERFGRPLACIVITAGRGAEGAPAREELILLAERLRRSTRQSDVLARIGARDFAVIAPDTPLHAATILADRLRTQGGERESSSAGPLRAGVCAIADPRVVKVDPLELIERATSASRVGPSS
jgi:two-component system, cell cycle response regulator